MTGSTSGLRWIVAGAIGLVLALCALAVMLRHADDRPKTTLDARRADVVRVETRPIPEGPIPRPFERSPTGNALPLAPLEPFIPDPLPSPLDQHGCSVGGNMILTLADGRIVTYGPCYRPRSINRLWGRMWGMVPSHQSP